MKGAEDTLYLPIKQVYFDQIVAGTKTSEYREIKEGATANRYLLRDPLTGEYLRAAHAVVHPTKKVFLDDYNYGVFPFLPKRYKKLYLAVGYAKERDTALVEVTGISFIPQMIRKDRGGYPKYCFWVIEYHLGRVLELHRKKR